MERKHLETVNSGQFSTKRHANIATGQDLSSHVNKKKTTDDPSTYEKQQSRSQTEGVGREEGSCFHSGYGPCVVNPRPSPHPPNPPTPSVRESESPTPKPLQKLREVWFESSANALNASTLSLKASALFSWLALYAASRMTGYLDTRCNTVDRPYRSAITPWNKAMCW